MDTHRLVNAAVSPDFWANKVWCVGKYGKSALIECPSTSLLSYAHRSQMPPVSTSGMCVAPRMRCMIMKTPPTYTRADSLTEQGCIV